MTKETASDQIRVKPSVRKRLKILAAEKELTIAALIEEWVKSSK